MVDVDMSGEAPVEGSPSQSTERRDFWIAIGYAFAVGVLGAFVGLEFLGVVHAGSNMEGVARSGSPARTPQDRGP